MRQRAIERILKYTTAWTEKELDIMYLETQELVEFSLQLEKAVKFAYLGLGSNLGNRIDNIRRAKNQLYLNDIEIVKSSSYYESLSWPNKKKFGNLCSLPSLIKGLN